MKRDTLLEKLGLPVNQTMKDLITASSKYGITVGSHDAPEIKLTEEGAKSVSATASLERNSARIRLGITGIEPFKKLYEKFGGGKMPAVEAMRDCLDELNEGDRAPCVDIFVQNAKFVGILQTKEGADWPSGKRKKLVNLKPSLKTISLRLPVSMIEDLKVLANRRDVPYQSLLKVFLAERLARERQPHLG